MKPKYAVAFALVLLGTNIFTYATTRYWTTSHILPKAHENVVAVLAKHYPEDIGPGQDLSKATFWAVNIAGGMYYWWNAAGLYWIAGGFLTITGLLVTQLDSKAAKNA